MRGIDVNWKLGKPESHRLQVLNELDDADASRQKKSEGHLQCRQKLFFFSDAYPKIYMGTGGKNVHHRKYICVITHASFFVLF